MTALCLNLTPKGAFWYETSHRWLRDKQPVDTYASFEHDSRYSDNIVENAYVDELTNFFAVLKGEEQPRWSFEKDLKAIELMDKIENS